MLSLARSLQDSIYVLSDSPPPFLQIYKVSTSCDLYEAFSITEPVSTSTASRWHTLSSLYWTENSLLVIAVKGIEFKLCKLTGSSIVKQAWNQMSEKADK